MANNYNPKAQFQGSAQSGEYRSAQIASIVPHMKEEQARQVQGWQNYINETAKNNERMVRAARMAGSDMQHLSKLSKTLSDTFFELDEWYKKDAEINEQWELLGGGDAMVGEVLEEAKELDHDLAEISAQGRQQVEEQNGLHYGQRYQDDTPQGQIATTYASGLQALSMAQTSYSPYLQGWVTSNARIRIPGYEGTVAGAYATGDARVIAAATLLGRQLFLRGLNLEGATKADVVKYLGTTVPQAEGRVNMAAVTAGAENRRNNQRQEIAGQGYTAVQSQPHSSMQEQFTNLSDTFFFSGAYPDRASANKAAVETLTQGLVDKGDVEGLRVLLGVSKIPGQAGTELAGQYGPEINKAILQAGRNRNALDSLAVQDVERRMYEDLTKAPTAAARAERVEAAAQELEGLGQYEKARELRENSGELSVDGGSTRTAAELMAQVRQGILVDPRQIDEYVLRGQISPAQGQQIKNVLGSEYEYNKPTDKLGADVAKAGTDRATKNFEVALGLRRDATGNIISIDGAALTAGEAEVITAQMERDINAEVNQFLRKNPGLSEQQKLIGLNNLINDWYKRNVETKGGKYFIDPRLLGAESGDAFDKADAQKELGQRMRGLMERAPTFSTPNTNFGTFDDKNYAVPQSYNWTPGSGLSRVDAQEFNPLRGDIIFTPVAVQYHAQDFNERGIIDPNLAKAAEQVGMSPLTLLRQQISAHGLNVQLKAPPLKTATREAPLTAVDGANALMAMGVPSKGAAWLSGNIMQESGWNGNRAPWDDVGAPAGGLVSWRAGRLTNAEAAFGEVEQASTEQQLQYMLKEMKENYPSAYRVFMNPYATDRQLMRASSLYWGYGDVGERFSYARQVERQLQRVPQEKRAETVSLMNMPAKQRTIAVGQKIIQEFGLKPWQHPNFDADKGYVAEGGARNWERPYNSYHNHNQALDIPLHPYGGAKLDELYAYLQKNRKQLGITELLWRCPNHTDHLHVAFG